MEILQLQQIRRMWEDLQRQIRSLHAAVRESTTALTNSRRSRQQPSQSTSESEMQDGDLTTRAQNGSSEERTESNESSVVQMSVSEMLELARISGSEEEGPSSQEQNVTVSSNVQENACTSSSSNNTFTREQVDKNLSANSATLPQPSESVQSCSNECSVPSTSSCGSADQKSNEKSVSSSKIPVVSGKSVQDSVTESTRQEDSTSSGGATSTSDASQSNVNNYDGDISQSVDDGVPVNTNEREATSESNQSGGERPGSSSGNDQSTSGNASPFVCMPKYYQPTNSGDHLYAKSPNSSQLKWRLSRRFSLRRPRLLAGLRAAKKHSQGNVSHRSTQR